MICKIEDAHVGHATVHEPARTGRQRPQGIAKHPHRRGGHAGQGATQVMSRLLTPFQGQPEQQFEAGGTRLGFGKRQRLGISIHWRVIAHQGIDGAVCKSGAQRVSVAHLPQRWRQSHGGVEVADVDVGQMELVDADVAGDRQALGLGAPHQFHARRAAQAADVHPSAGVAHQFEQGVERDGFGNHRHAAQTHAGGQGPLGGHAAAQVAVLSAQPGGVAKGRGVLQRAVQHQCVVQRDLSVREADAAGLRQFGHLGQHLAGQPPCERSQRIQVRLVEVARAKLQHLDQAGLVQRRVGVGQAHQAGHAAGCG